MMSELSRSQLGEKKGCRLIRNGIRNIDVLQLLWDVSMILTVGTRQIQYDHDGGGDEAEGTLELGGHIDIESRYRSLNFSPSCRYPIVVFINHNSIFSILAG